MATAIKVATKISGNRSFGLCRLVRCCVCTPAEVDEAAGYFLDIGAAVEGGDAEVTRALTAEAAAGGQGA